MKFLALLPLFLIACDGGVDTGTDTDPDTDAEEEAPLVTGDFSCFTPAGSFAASTWLTQTVAAGASVPVDLDGLAYDFQEGVEESVHDATVSIWDGDLATSAPDREAVSDADGLLSIDATTCSALSYRVTTNPERDATKPTYKGHQTYGPDATDAEFVSVSTDSFLLIPAIYGITPDPTKSIIAGTAFDCSREPDASGDDDAGKLAGIRAVLTDASGVAVEDVQVRYFTEKFPDRDLSRSSEDGLWTIINVPAGSFRVEMWGRIEEGGEEVLLGATQLTSVADSINISNHYAGYGDGVKYPIGCVAE